MADRLIVIPVQDRALEGYTITWFLNDDDEYGATLGDGGDGDDGVADFDKEIETALQLGESDMVLHWVGTKALYFRHISGLGQVSKVGTTGFVFASKKEALRCLSQINLEAKKLLSGVPWPEWTVPALAAGWKPPKGWHPGANR